MADQYLQALDIVTVSRRQFHYWCINNASGLWADASSLRAGCFSGPTYGRRPGRPRMVAGASCVSVSHRCDIAWHR